MLSYRQISVYLGPAPAFSRNLADLQAVNLPSGHALYAVTQTGGGFSAFRISGADRPISLIETRSYGGAQGYLDRPGASIVEIGGGAALFAPGLVNAAAHGIRLGANGDLNGAVSLSGAGRLAADVTHLGSFSTAGGSFLVSARNATTALEVWKVQSDGGIARIDGSEALSIPGVDRAEISDLEVVSMGDRQYLLTGSSAGNYVASHMLEANGALGRANIAWADSGSGMNAPQQLESFTVAGVSYVVVGAARSSSLTLYRMTYDGALIATDHVLDERTTRFAGASTLEAVTLNGRAFVFAGGSDDGISVFTVMPNGQLLHLATIADTDGRSLADVSAISALVIDGRIAVFISSRTEAGITQFMFEPGAIGQTLTVGPGRYTGGANSDMLRAGSGTTQVSGGVGNDVLISGTGPVTLTGGAGEDLFVVTPVAGRILISDFAPGTDRLDLSGLGMIRSVMQLQFRVLSDGIRITFGDTQIQIRTADRTALAANFFNNTLFPIAHYDAPVSRTSMLGSSGNDTLSASAAGSTGHGLDGRDLLNGHDGRDLLSGGGGNDTLNGAGGTDTLLGDAGNDLVQGGAGNDRLAGGTDQDTVNGGDGDDTLSDPAGNDLHYGGAGNDVIGDPYGDNVVWAGSGNDRVNTGAGRDRIYGEVGNDTVNAGSGDDSVLGGDGDDMLAGGLGNDLLNGGSGNDVMSGADGNDAMDGSGGNDNMGGQNGSDRMLGGSGNDTIGGGTGNDTVLGGDGNDILFGQDGNDLLRGETGNDRLLGGTGNDIMDGFSGNDYMNGEAGNDTLWGGIGLDTLHGGDGHDLLRGGTQNDMLNGQTGNDTLFGDVGNDTLLGAQGNDLIHGNGDSDRLDGGEGSDSLFGDDGADHLVDLFGHNFLAGGTGNDVIRAGAGNDRIEGGRGSDHLTGGGGADVFIFRSALDHDRGRDVIADFDTGRDRLDLAGLGLRFVGETGFTTGRQVRAHETAAGMLVEVDLNGDGHADLSLQLNGVSSLTRGDFLL